MWSPASSALQVGKILTQWRFNPEPPSPVLANIHSILPSESCCHAAACLYTSYTRCRPTHPILVQYWASVAAHCWFNAGQLTTTLAQRYSNTGPADHASRGPTTAGTPSFNGNPTCLTMAQQQPNIGSLSLAGSAWVLCSRTARHCYAGDALLPLVQQPQDIKQVSDPCWAAVFSAEATQIQRKIQVLWKQDCQHYLLL